MDTSTQIYDLYGDELVDQFVYHPPGECPPTPPGENFGIDALLDGTAFSAVEELEDEAEDAEAEPEAQSVKQDIAMEAEIFGIDALLDGTAFSSVRM